MPCNSLGGKGGGIKRPSRQRPPRGGQRPRLGGGMRAGSPPSRGRGLGAAAGKLFKRGQQQRSAGKLFKRARPQRGAGRRKPRNPGGHIAFGGGNR